MKRFVCLLAVLMLLLCGCTPEEPTTVPTTVPEETDPLQSRKNMGILWLISVVAAFIGGAVVPLLFKKRPVVE